MKVKTSISLSSAVIDRVGMMTSEGNRSEFIEKALWSYLAVLERASRDRKDLEIIKDSASRLNAEALDTLDFQIPV